MADTTKTSKGRTDASDSGTFTEDERDAMKERARELKAEARRAKAGKVDGEADLLAKIAEMSDADRAMAERIHAIVKEHAPSLESRTWYGMPAYAKDGKTVFFFQPAEKFKARYSTLGFNDSATLDDGTMWPTSWALTKLSAKDEAAIAALIKRAIG